ncbi:nuclear transport factor 2 family protein [Brevundimonas sp. LM2]|uniref:nuclear transport factor 2 family protein n=1 Tax=Brevundimonas sp. LM2 TaxID=1938605 RepID=UPI0009857E8B|nr:nuclear transport factor 2 family protein [Brevundimonas sp. LM2]
MRQMLIGVMGLLLMGAAAPDPEPTEASLRAADAEQMRIIVEEDAAAQQAFMHPNYMINAPANAVKRKAEVVAMLGRGDIASETFERSIEAVALTGNVGIVMGREAVTPAPASNLGRLHPGETLQRRFTNVFLWEGGRWMFLARQASIVAP